MASTRDNAITNESILLYFWFYKNGVLYDAASIIDVGIYNEYRDAVSSVRRQHLIAGVDVTHVETGKYKYIIPGETSVGTYFDKITLKPEPSSTTTLSYINPYYVRHENYGGVAPGDMEKTRIILNVFDVVGNAKAGDKVFALMNKKYAWYGKTLVEQEREEFCVDENGMATVWLLETDTLTQDTGSTIYYKVTAGYNEYVKYFTIPKGTLDANLVDLPDYTGITSDFPC
jgi:hypothetical protein